MLFRYIRMEKNRIYDDVVLRKLGFSVGRGLKWWFCRDWDWDIWSKLLTLVGVFGHPWVHPSWCLILFPRIASTVEPRTKVVCRFGYIWKIEWKISNSMPCLDLLKDGEKSDLRWCPFEKIGFLSRKGVKMMILSRLRLRHMIKVTYPRGCVFGHPWVHPFHLTRYSVEPFWCLVLFPRIASTGK